MRTTCCGVRLLLLTIILNAPAMLASAAAPVSQAWAVRIDGPTDASLLVSGMDVGASGDVFLVGPFRSGGYYLRDILITRRSSSGTLVWQRSYEPPEGPSANEYPSGIVAHGTNIYVAGSITTTNGRTDFLTLKYRDTGELEWVARSERPVSYSAPIAITVDGQGNALVLGGSVVLKYGPAGNLLWTYSYDSPVRAVEMRVDADGNIYVAGTAGASSSELSPVTLKLDPDGHELWRALESSINLQGGTANGLDIDSAGNVVTVARDMSYGMIWKYDANGTRQWMALYRAEDSQAVYAAEARFDGSGNIIVAAQLYGVGDALLIKYAPDGQQLWASRISHPNGIGYLGHMDLDNAGNSYLIRSLITSTGDDVGTVKVNPDGAQLWSVIYDSQIAADSAEFIDVTPSGGVYVTGRSFYSGQTFVSLVKYTQQTVSGVVTAVVTPALQVVDPGANVVLTAETIGPGPIHFQWRKNGRAISDGTNSTLSFPNVQGGHRGDYSVIVSNAAGATVSPDARLLVRVPPEVVIAPGRALAYVGTATAFSAAVSGNDFATLQWRHEGTNIPGATNATLWLVNLNAEARGNYDIIVSTFGGSTTSSPAVLTVSRAVDLIDTTPHRSSTGSYGYAPQLSVLPNGESLIASRSNHAMGSSIVLDKHAPNGDILWSSPFQSAEFANVEPTHLLLDGGGNIYIAGQAVQLYSNAAIVLKYTPDGRLLWSRFLANSNRWPGLQLFAVDPQGNSVIAGLSTAVIVNRYSPTGDPQWSYVDPSPDNDTLSLAVSRSSDTYIGTTIRTTTGGGNEIRLRKFDSTGTLVWTIPSLEGQFNRLATLAVDAADHLIVAGTGGLEEDGPMFVQKYSSGGQKLWDRRVGNSWREIGYIYALAVGPGNDITVLNRSDDDYDPGEESGLTRIGSDGQLKYRISDREILPGTESSSLAVDSFGNAYVAGMFGVTAKYDAYGSRQWLVYYSGPEKQWPSVLAIGVDVIGDVRVLATDGSGSGSNVDFSLLHYRQRDPASTYRLRLIRDAGGTFHLATPAQDSFCIEASADLQSWDLLTEEQMQQLLQPGATSFANSPERFFRLIFVE